MSAHEIVAAALVGIGVLVVALCALAMLVVPEAYPRFHFLGPASTVGTWGVCLGVVLVEGWGTAAVEVLLLAIGISGAGAVLTHASARAMRIREHGDWRGTGREAQPGAGSE